MPRRMRWGKRWMQIEPWMTEIAQIFKVLSCGPRWAIIKILSTGEKTTGEIFDELVSKYAMNMPRSLLYYHLDALEKAGIVEAIGYRETEKGGAPEKVWRLRIRRIVIDIVSGDIKFE